MASERKKAPGKRAPAKKAPRKRPAASTRMAATSARARSMPAKRTTPAKGWDAYLAAIVDGATERMACVLCGVPLSTMQAYVKADESGERLEAERDAREVFLSDLFAEVLMLARLVIRAPTKRDAKIATVKLNALRFALEKRDPERFAKVLKNEHSGPGGGPMTTVTRYSYQLPENKLLLGERGHEEDDDG